VKKSMFVAAAVLILPVVMAAQTKPTVTLHYAGNPAATIRMQNNPAAVTPPALCRPCFFYGGDINPNDANVDAFSDENTLYIGGQSATYGAVILPYQAALHGIVFNLLSSGAFDPQLAAYDIRENVSGGNGGFSVQHGTSKIEIETTGRNAFGFFEYALAVHFPTVTLEPGVEYWFNVEPQCVNGAQDGSCYFGRFFASNTTQGTNNINGADQPAQSMFINSSILGFPWVNWCDPQFTLNPAQCGLLSFGLMGTPN
jgi:hypothetical protein